MPGLRSTCTDVSHAELQRMHTALVALGRARGSSIDGSNNAPQHRQMILRVARVCHGGRCKTADCVVVPLHLLLSLHVRNHLLLVIASDSLMDDVECEQMRAMQCWLGSS
jgi:hypothetical protein